MNERTNERIYSRNPIVNKPEGFMRVTDHCMLMSKFSSGLGSFLDHGDAYEVCSDQKEDAGKQITWRARCGLSSPSSSDIIIEPRQELQRIRNRYDHQISPGGKLLFPWEDEAEAPKKTEEGENSHSHFHFHFHGRRRRRRRRRKTSKRDRQRFGFRVSTEGAARHGHGSDLGFGDDDEEEEEEEENYSYNGEGGGGGGLMAVMREKAKGSERSRPYSMDMEEVKACRDLGFELELELKHHHHHHQLRSAASSGSDSPTIIPQYYWRVSSPGDDPRDVKARLKQWAQAVALASATSPRR